MPDNFGKDAISDSDLFKKKRKTAARMRDNMAAEGYSEDDIKYAVGRYMNKGTSRGEKGDAPDYADPDGIGDEELDQFVKRAKGKKNASK